MNLFPINVSTKQNHRSWWCVSFEYLSYFWRIISPTFIRMNVLSQSERFEVSYVWNVSRMCLIMRSFAYKILIQYVTIFIVSKAMNPSGNLFKKIRWRAELFGIQKGFRNRYSLCNKWSLPSVASSLIFSRSFLVMFLNISLDRASPSFSSLRRVRTPFVW